MLNKEEHIRYSRHIKLANVGVKGQERLKNAKVLVIGAGGLGCPVLQYLVAAGVGKIGVVDDDVVDFSNLQRQILFNESDVGRFKVDVAVEKVSRQNSGVEFQKHITRLDETNALSIFKEYDIVIDGTDNFPTRYLVNDACVIADKPLVFGSIFKFEGQLSVFNYKGGPSYRCLYPTPPSSNEVPNCSEVGVIGALPGIVGVKMAMECLKLILEIGEPLSGKLEVINLLNNQNLLLSISRNDENFNISKLQKIELEQCEIQPDNEVEEITPEILNDLLKQGKNIQLIDVREPFEIEICSIAGSLNIPLGEVLKRQDEIKDGVQTVVICHHGIRSEQALIALEKAGKKNLFNLKGGIDNWAKTVDTGMVRY